MDVFEIIRECEKSRATKEDYVAAYELLSKEYDKLSESDKEYVGDAFEFLEMSIEWLS